MKIRYIWLVFALGSFLFCTPFEAITALELNGVGGRPANPDPTVQYSDSWFMYKLNPGETKEDAIELINSSDQEQSVRLYAVDAVAASEGSFSLETEEQPRDEIGSWITITTSTITLAPHATLQVPFTITIPEGADIGEHAGGIIIQKAAQTGAMVDQSGASITTRVGIRVYEIVPGDIIRDVVIDNLSITPTTGQDGSTMYRIDLAVTNKSNVSLPAHVKMKIGGWGMQEYFAKSKAEGALYVSDLTNFFSGEELEHDWQLFKDKQVSTNWEWPKPAFGRYTFQAIVSFDDEGTSREVVSDTVVITIIPWLELGVVFLILVVVIGGLVIRKRMFGARRWKPYTVRPGDDLLGLAVAAGVSWKKLMKANALKGPALRVGQVIRVPQKLAQVHARAVTHQPDDFVEGRDEVVSKPVRRASSDVIRRRPVSAGRKITVTTARDVSVAKSKKTSPRKKRVE